MKRIATIIIGLVLTIRTSALEIRFVDVGAQTITFDLAWGETTTSDYAFGQLGDSRADAWDVGTAIVLDVNRSDGWRASGHLDLSAGREFGDAFAVGLDGIILDPIQGDPYGARVTFHPPADTSVPDGGGTLGMLVLGLCGAMLVSVRKARIVQP